MFSPRIWCLHLQHFVGPVIESKLNGFATTIRLRNIEFVKDSRQGGIRNRFCFPDAARPSINLMSSLVSLYDASPILSLSSVALITESVTDLASRAVGTESIPSPEVTVSGSRFFQSPVAYGLKAFKGPSILALIRAGVTDLGKATIRWDTNWGETCEKSG